MRKFIIRIVLQSFSDIITNSSSELFTFLYGTTEFIEKQLDEWAPGWREEYEKPILFSDMEEDRQCEYIGWVADIPYFDLWNYKGKEGVKEYNREITRYISRELCIPEEEVPKVFNNWDKPKHCNLNGKDYIYYNLELSDFGYELFKNKYKNDICLWSFDDNPNWDRQECIMNILHGKRYHLG